MTAPAIGATSVVLAAGLVWLFSPAPPAARDEAATTELPPAEPVIAQSTEPPAITEPVPSSEVVGDIAQSVPQPSAQRAPLPGETPAMPLAEFVAERQNLSGAGAGVAGVNDELPPSIAAVELEFAEEPVDHGWAPGAEAAVFAVFAQIPGLELIDQQVECRSTMCRIQLTQPSSANDQQSPFNALRDSIGLEPRWMLIGGSGSATLRSIGYFWREGFAPRQEAGQPHLRN